MDNNSGLIVNKSSKTLTPAYVFRGLHEANDPTVRKELGNYITNTLIPKMNETEFTKAYSLVNQMRINDKFVAKMSGWSSVSLLALTNALERIKPIYDRGVKVYSTFGIDNLIKLPSTDKTSPNDVISFYTNIGSEFENGISALETIVTKYNKVIAINDRMNDLHLYSFISDGVEKTPLVLANFNSRVLEEILKHENEYETWINAVANVPGAKFINSTKNTYNLSLPSNTNGSNFIKVSLPNTNADISDLKSAGLIINALPDKLKDMFATLGTNENLITSNWLLENAKRARDYQDEWIAEQEEIQRQKEEEERRKKEEEENTNYAFKIIIIIVGVVLVMVLFLVIYAGVSKSKRNKHLLMQKQMEEQLMLQQMMQQQSYQQMPQNQYYDQSYQQMPEQMQY